MPKVTSPSHLTRSNPEPGFEVRKCLGRLSKSLLDVKNGQPLVASRVPNTPGRHERKACDIAMSAACEVLRNHPCKSSEQAAMSRAQGILEGGSPDRFGNIILNQLVALGALRMGIVDRIASCGGSADLISRLERIDSAIIDIAVAAGRVKGIADGCRGSDEESQKLDKLLGKAENTVAACIGKGEEAAKLMASISSAILAGPMMDAVRQRLPALAAKMDAGELELDANRVIHAGFIHSTEHAIRHKLSMGDGENVASAIFDLFKLPQFVVSSDPGSANPAPPGNGTGPNIDPALRDLQGISKGTGAPILYNHSPTKVKNDFSGLRDLLPHHDGQSVREQLKDVFNLGMAAGVKIGRLEEQNRQLREQLGQRGAGGADEHSGLTTQNDRSGWMVGPEKLFLPTSSASTQHDFINDGIWNAEENLGGGSAYLLSDQDMDDLNVAAENLRRLGSGSREGLQHRQLDPFSMPMVGKGAGSDEVDAGEGSGDDDGVSSISQAEADEIIFGDLMRLMEERDRIDAAGDAALRGSVQTPVLMQPNASVSVARSIAGSVAQRVRHFESMGPAQTRPTGEEDRRNATNGVDIRSSAEAVSVDEYFRPRQLPRVTAAASVEVEASNASVALVSRQSSVAETSNVGGRGEFDALRAFRAGQGRDVSPISIGDEFRDAFEADGGPAYRPVVPPQAPAKEEVMHELERHFARFKQPRSIGSSFPLSETSGAINGRGPIVGSADARANADDGSDPEPTTARPLRLDGNRHVQKPVPPVPSVLQLFDPRAKSFSLSKPAYGMHEIRSLLGAFNS